MNKRYVAEYKDFIYKGERVPFSPGTLAVIFFCTTLLIVATFTKLDISHFWLFHQDGEWVLGLKKYQLVPQVAAIMLTAGLLGARYSFIVIFLYFLTGFFLWPVFAFGGGIGYVKSYFFGYILGFFAASIFAGRILSHKYDLKNMVYAAVIGVLSIHICGLLYSFILGFFSTFPYNPDFHIVTAQIVYDILFSIIAILIAKPLKFILWIAMKNDTKAPPVKPFVETN